MTRDDLAVGAKVQLVKRIGGNYPGAMFDIAPGPTGTVIAVFPHADEDAGEPIAHIRFDEPQEDLEEWDNELPLWGDQLGDAGLDDFTLIPPGFY